MSIILFAVGVRFLLSCGSPFFMEVGVVKFVIDVNNCEISSVKYFSNRFTVGESLRCCSLGLVELDVVDGGKLCLEWAKIDVPLILILGGGGGDSNMAYGLLLQFHTCSDCLGEF